MTVRYFWKNIQKNETCTLFSNSYKLITSIFQNSGKKKINSAGGIVWWSQENSIRVNLTLNKRLCYCVLVLTHCCRSQIKTNLNRAHYYDLLIKVVVIKCILWDYVSFLQLVTELRSTHFQHLTSLPLLSTPDADCRWDRNKKKQPEFTFMKGFFWAKVYQILACCGCYCCLCSVCRHSVTSWYCVTSAEPRER